MTIIKTIVFFDQVGIDDIHIVGRKNASLGEIYNQLNTLSLK